MTIYEQFLNLLELAIKRYGNANKLAQHLNVPANQITRWKNRERIPQLDTIQPLMDVMKAELVLMEDKNAKDVHFINAYIVEANGELPPPQEEDYLAAPILGEVGAGQGIIPEENIRGWFMVHRSVVSGRGLHTLIAVEIGVHSISMRPTLNPGDIVLVDLDDVDCSRDGKIMLVSEPEERAGMVKRVSAREQKGDVQITFYSDNSAQYSPQVYSLMKDFDGDWRKAIVGRVIWAWTDMRGK